VASFAEENTLLVCQGEHPGKLGCHLATRASVRPGDPRRREAGSGDARTTGSIGRQQPLECGS
jgi:hypothetical protein